MHTQLAGWDDTIAALATPPGIGAIGVIRISGKNALIIADKLFPAKKISQQASHTLHVGMLKHDDVVLDEAVIAVFKNPRSYTGEDVIEISCHGSNYILQQVLQAITSYGARPAKPGELLSSEGIIGCGRGAIRLLEVQPEGKKVMKASDWLRGQKNISF